MFKKMIDWLIREGLINRIVVIFMFVIMMTVLTCIKSEAIEVETRVNKSYTTFETAGLAEFKSGLEYELRISHENIFIWGSKEDIMLYSNWQDIKAFGFGLKYDLEKFDLPFTIWTKVGYYMPKNDQMIPWEPGYIAQNKFYHDSNIGSFKGDYYAIILDPNWGGEFGIDFEKKIIGNLSLGISGSYRILTIYEHMDAWLDGQERGTTGWIMEQNRDFSGFRTGIFLKYEF